MNLTLLELVLLSYFALVFIVIYIGLFRDVVDKYNWFYMPFLLIFVGIFAFLVGTLIEIPFYTYKNITSQPMLKSHTYNIKNDEETKKAMKALGFRWRTSLVDAFLLESYRINVGGKIVAIPNGDRLEVAYYVWNTKARFIHERLREYEMTTAKAEGEAK